jgi:hypothetical protein
MSTRPGQTRLSLKPSGPPTAYLGSTTQPPPRRPWYARRWTLVAAVVVLGGGSAVLVDFPHPVTKVQQVKEAAALVRTVDSSIHPCAYAAAQAFSLYHEDNGGSLSASERAQVPGLLADDAKACSFTNTSVAQLGTEIFGTLTLSSTPAGRDLTAMVKSVLDWVASDSQGAIDALRTMLVHPRDAKAAGELRKREGFLAQDRAAADAAVDRARTDLRTSHVPYPDLPNLPHP